MLEGRFNDRQAELFRAQMLTEMAQMSLEDGLVMQIHPGSVRNHNRKLYARYGRDMGADIPRRPTMWTRCAPCSIASAMSAILLSFFLLLDGVDLQP